MEIKLEEQAEILAKDRPKLECTILQGRNSQTITQLGIDAFLLSQRF